MGDPGALDRTAAQGRSIGDYLVWCTTGIGGRRLLSLDGTACDMADTPANAAALGRPPTGARPREMGRFPNSAWWRWLKPTPTPPPGAPGVWVDRSRMAHSRGQFIEPHHTRSTLLRLGRRLWPACLCSPMSRPGRFPGCRTSGTSRFCRTRPAFRRTGTVPWPHFIPPGPPRMARAPAAQSRDPVRTGPEGSGRRCGGAPWF